MCNPKLERYGLKSWPSVQDTLSETKHPKLYTPKRDDEHPRLFHMGVSPPGSARRELSRVGEPKCLYEKKLSRLPGLPYLPRRDNSPSRGVSLPETTRAGTYKRLVESFNDFRASSYGPGWPGWLGYRDEFCLPFIWEFSARATEKTHLCGGGKW